MVVRLFCLRYLSTPCFLAIRLFMKTINMYVDMYIFFCFNGKINLNVYINIYIIWGYRVVCLKKIHNPCWFSPLTFYSKIVCLVAQANVQRGVELKKRLAKLYTGPRRKPLFSRRSTIFHPLSCFLHTHTQHVFMKCFDNNSYCVHSWMNVCWVYQIEMIFFQLPINWSDPQK